MARPTWPPEKPAIFELPFICITFPCNHIKIVRTVFQQKEAKYDQAREGKIKHVQREPKRRTRSDEHEPGRRVGVLEIVKFSFQNFSRLVGSDGRQAVESGV